MQETYVIILYTHFISSFGHSLIMPITYIYFDYVASFPCLFSFPGLIPLSPSLGDVGLYSLVLSRCGRVCTLFLFRCHRVYLWFVPLCLIVPPGLYLLVVKSSLFSLTFSWSFRRIFRTWLISRSDGFQFFSLV